MIRHDDQQRSQQRAAFIKRAQELYQTDPLAAAIMLADGIRNLLESHGLTPTPLIQPPNYHFMHHVAPLPDHAQKRLDVARRSLARIAQEAADGVTPEPDEWEMEVENARSAIQLAAEVHG